MVRPNSLGYPNNYGKIVNKAQICAEQEPEHAVGSFAAIYGREWRYYYVNNRYPINRCCPLSSNTYDCSTHYRLNIDTPEVTPSGHPWPDCKISGLFRFPAGGCGPPASGLSWGTYRDPRAFAGEDIPDYTQFCHANNIYHSDLSWAVLPLTVPLQWTQDSINRNPNCRQSWQPER